MRARPRLPHPADAVMIGGLAAVATVPMPTGGYVPSATPARLYAPERAENLFVRPGDDIRFEAIDTETFAALAARGATGERVVRHAGVFR